jgi:hypothetical protein
MLLLLQSMMMMMLMMTTVPQLRFGAEEEKAVGRRVRGMLPLGQ